MSPNPFSQKVKIYTQSAISLTVIAVLLRIFNFLFHFDTTVDYFNHSPFHIAYLALCILTVAWLLSSLFLIPRYSFSTKVKPRASFASRLTGLACACITAISFLFFRENMFFYANHAGIYNLLAIFSLLGIIYFAFQFIGDIPPSFTVLTEYIVIVWLGMMLCATYLNLYVAMNSPFKITIHMALLSMMLYLIEDARLHTDHGFRIPYFTYTLIGIFNCSLASVPVLIAYALDLYHNVDYLFYAALSLCFLLFLCTRAYDCYKLLMVTPPASPEEIAEDKEKKNKEKKENRNKEKATEGDDNHVS